MTLEELIQQAQRRYVTPKAFEEVKDGDELLGWTYVVSGGSVTARYGYAMVTGEHPHETLNYRSYAEDHIRKVMGRPQT